MFTIPCPEEVFISTELSSGLGRRLPCYSTPYSAVIMREENSLALLDEQQETSSANDANKYDRNYPAHQDESKEKHRLILEELKRQSPPGYEEFEAAVGSKGLDDETALQLWEDIFKL